MKWAPHNYQKRAVAFMIERACAGLFLDPGLGKTIVCLAAFDLLRKRRLVTRMLVVAPLRVCYSTWPAEAAKWDGLEGLKVGVLHGPDKERVLQDPRVNVHVINPEGLPWLLAAIGAETVPEDFWETLVVDESTRFKAHNTQRHKLIKLLLPKFARRYILTGSPAPNGLLDLWGQCYILDLGNALGAYISHYRTQFFVPEFNGFGWKPQKDAEERIYKRLAPLVLRMSAEDYLDMPPLIGACGDGREPLVRWVDLPSETMKQYLQMQELMITELKGEKITAANAATASGKCRQISNGGIYVGDTAALDSRASYPGRVRLAGGRDYYPMHEEKVDAVAEIVEELQGTPALVRYEFEHDLHRLLKRFPGTPWVGGGVAPKRFKEVEAAWNRGELPLLFGQTASVALGLNLQGTKAHIIDHSLTWNWEDYDQGIRRIWRQGQKDRVFVHHVAARGTIDEVILKALGRKDKTQRALLSALKENYL